MENQYYNQPQGQYYGSQPQQQLVFSEHIQQEFRSACSWIKFLCIINFIGQALMVFGGISTMVASSHMYRSDKTVGLIVGLIYIGAAILSFIPTLKFMQYASKANDAMNFGDQETMDRAFSNLAFAAKFQGILTIIAIVLVIVCILLFVVALNTRHF